MRKYQRFWILSLLRGIETAGLAPLPLKEVNALAYLANAVAPCFDLEPIAYTVLKEREGPLYPELIWNIDRLVGMGLVRVSNLILTGASVKSASYSITERGLDIITQCRGASKRFDNVSGALHSVALAFSRHPNSMENRSLLAYDGNYANSRYGLGDVVDFGAWDDENSTSDAIEAVKSETWDQVQLPTTMAVNLYADYLASAPSTQSVEAS
ncbi:hypothetical protein [Burkholderia gladioli]|uniref:hypothetical protein n=1 Tax=Burkholderia gladioli TaxID=28095 RepID=UPI00163F5196|nr:hypothetical protein [Burkholderia gladioli]